MVSSFGVLDEIRDWLCQTEWFYFDLNLLISLSTTDCFLEVWKSETGLEDNLS